MTEALKNALPPGEVTSAFRCGERCLSLEPYGSGHINDTFLAHYARGSGIRPYILQRVNRHVFTNIPALMDNVGRVTRHLRRGLAADGVDDIDRRVLTLVPTRAGKDFWVDARGETWRAFLFVEGARGYDVVESPRQAFEAARAFGEFQRRLADLPGRLHETIPHFHHARDRFEALRDAIHADIAGRARAVEAEIEFALSRESMVDVVIDLMASGDIPERVTHNDTKLNNVLIDETTGRGICVIDLDTVMPGSVLYDFGDMVRSTTNTAAEDEGNPDRVEMHIGYFEALVTGYLQSLSEFLVPAEKAHLAFAGRLVTFVIGLRFLTDYLRGDVYFKTSRKDQNLDRCRKQFKMVQSIEGQMDAMQQIVDRAS